LSQEQSDGCFSRSHESNEEHGARPVRRVHGYRLGLGHRAPRVGLRGTVVCPGMEHTWIKSRTACLYCFFTRIVPLKERS
jgi:hypothetical protein